VAELADALDSKSSGTWCRVGSTPSSGTNLLNVTRSTANPCPLRADAATLASPVPTSTNSAAPPAAPSRASSATPAAPPRSLSGFWALIAVQFQNAFSDNALKWLVSFLILESFPDKNQRDLWFVLVVPLLFAVPFLIFSIPGGYFADKYSKRSVTLGVKVFELIVMTLAAFALSRNRVDLASLALFLACTQGAIFGPTKYALLPELLPESKLSWGNGIIELTTLLSAIFAALAGGFLAQHFRGRQAWSGGVFIALTVTGMLFALLMPRLPAADPARRFDWNFPREFFVETRRLWRNATLRMAVLANTFFWFLGSLLLLNIVLYATDILRVDDQHSSYLLAALSLGIGIGSFLAGYASAGKIEQGMILPGLAGLVIMTAILSIPGLSFVTVAILLSFVGVFGGFFVVPINALIQRIPPPEEKGRTIAVANLLSFVGVALQPLAQYAMIRLGHPNPSRIFLVSGAMSLVMGILLLRMMPALAIRALQWTRLRPSDTL
jgi:acyl-[acyl-carrier-protein]-phospholipid O-acyltransferase / long-chain-fatty-acid--[acyl-carrier-protein] ligase